MTPTTIPDMTVPLRDWAFSAFRHLDRDTLVRLNDWLIANQPVPEVVSGDLAADVFVDAVRFGSLTLNDFRPCDTPGCPRFAVAYWHDAGPLGAGTAWGCDKHAPADASRQRDDA